MMTSRKVFPDEVFDALLKKCSREQKRKNLTKLHEVCRAQFAGAKDFSLPAIGKLWEVAGGIKARALYNTPSADYRALIRAWAEHSGPVEDNPFKGLRPGGSKYESLLMRISDPVARGLVQVLAIERDKFRHEVNMLKAQTNLVIDRSPALTMPAASRTQASQEVFRLTMAEREALENSISPEFLAAEGWREGRSGELLNDAGRTFFQAGFTRAVRKALAAAS